ncbi:MAG: hypothetical protein U0R80_04375 [Nocardioidaceae bacterium]
MNGPRLVTRAGLRVLPSWARDRYEAEVDAELAELPWLRRWAHATAFAATSWPLRLEVLRGAAEARGFSAVPWSCLWGVHHRWRFAWTADGTRYRCCARCGLDDPRSGHTRTNPSTAGALIMGPPQ